MDGKELYSLRNWVRAADRLNHCRPQHPRTKQGLLTYYVQRTRRDIDLTWNGSKMRATVSIVGLGEGDGDTIAGRKLGMMSQIGLRGEGEGDAGTNVYFDRSIVSVTPHALR
jgi:hypothetical protein